MLFIFLTPELIRNLWQLKTAVFLHCCLICAVPLGVFVFVCEARGLASRFIHTCVVGLAILLSDAISIENLLSFQIPKMIWKDGKFSFEIASLSKNTRLTLLVYMSLVLKVTISF